MAWLLIKNSALSTQLLTTTMYVFLVEEGIVGLGLFLLFFAGADRSCATGDAQ